MTKITESAIEKFTGELRIKYPKGFELAVQMTKEEMEQHIG